jgi:hypothetical protein
MLIMRWNKLPLVVALVCLSPFAQTAFAEAAGKLRDLWIHPRNEAFDPALHYRAPNGELFYHAENDLGVGLDSIFVHGGAEPKVTALLGKDIWSYVAKNGGEILPVVLYDSDGDGKVDRTLRGRIEGQTAVFDGAQVGEVDWRERRWQMGIRYSAGATGKASDDRRYLASVEGNEAKVHYPRIESLPPVSEAPPETVVAGLVIYEHIEGKPFDVALMAREPGRYMGDFVELTPAKDADPWTMEEKDDGVLRTRLDQEELFLVRTRGDATLGVEWGDMPLAQYMTERLHVTPDADGCLSTMESRIQGDDGQHAPVPNRILYCPEAQMALFDAPPGYQIGLTAMQGEEAIAFTEASTTILDNVRLYGRQVYPRSPNARGTGTVAGNLKASFADSGQDVLDMGRHLVTGTTRTNIHTGQEEKRTSLLMAVPMLVVGLVKLDPLQGGADFVEGVSSGVQVAADGVSAVNNAVINPLLQTTVGLASPAAADSAGHFTGAVTQAWAQNLPGSERTFDALNPMSLWYHNRAFKPTAYTRTDTQLNIDRLISIANMVGIYGIVTTANGGGGGGGGGGGNGGGAPAPGPVSSPPPPVVPPPVTPPVVPLPPFVPGC